MPGCIQKKGYSMQENKPGTDLGKMKYIAMEAKHLCALRPFYRMRPNKSCDSAPLCHYLYREYYAVCFCCVEDGLLVMFCDDHGGFYCFPPYCREEDLPYYFRLQERYFNEVLGIPVVIYSADEEAVKALQEAGSLENYEVTEAEDLKDYLYDGDALRTLAGRKYSKKRNHLHKFEEMYGGRWEYRSLHTENSEEILSFLRRWMKNKEAAGEAIGVNENEERVDSMEELEGEYRGISSILHTPELFDYIRIGGIYIDGELKAFSIGDYNPAESMAIIDVEKAEPDIIGLYQAMNQQFLLHEYPDAKIINREDDVGLEGLRQSKMSYYPIGFERKYTLRQKNGPAEKDKD